MSTITARPATTGDFPAIATGRGGHRPGRGVGRVRPRLPGHLLEHGTLLVAERGWLRHRFRRDPADRRRPGRGQHAVRPVRPSRDARPGLRPGHPQRLWPSDRARAARMTFSSQHAHALPLYTRFGLDAWWPLLYLGGEVRALPRAGRVDGVAGQRDRGGGGGAGLDRRGPLRRSPGLGGPPARAAGAGLPARGTGRRGHGRRRTATSTAWSTWPSRRESPPVTRYWPCWPGWTPPGAGPASAFPRRIPRCGCCSRRAGATGTATCSWPPTPGCSTPGGRCRTRGAPDVPGERGNPRPTCRDDPAGAMMLCVDKKMLHDSRFDGESGPLPAGARPGGNGTAEYAADGRRRAAERP